MGTGFGALCTDFYVNQKLALKMDLPQERETVLHFFDRVRAGYPSMSHFRRYTNELSLESGRDEGEYRWVALRKQTVRSGHVNPESLDNVYRFHKLLLEISPYNLSISPLDVDYLELLFGFDLECKANHNEIVFDALYGDTPMASLMDQPDATPLDIQPIIGMSLSAKCDVQAYFEVKTRTTQSQVRNNKFRTEPISVFLTLRKYGALRNLEELKEIFDMLSEHCERLTEDKVIPDLLAPISRAISRNV